MGDGEGLTDRWAPVSLSTFGLIDADGSCLAVMVYNIAESWGVLIGDTVAVPEPHLKQHSIEHSGK
ncbi:hypothetical protein scyTo_0027348, partial [Scyliorhinus torazame]|nr:hypothetical protein [Scyliorhinus torazame]